MLLESRINNQELEETLEEPYIDILRKTRNLTLIIIYMPVLQDTGIL